MLFNFHLQFENFSRKGAAPRAIGKPKKQLGKIFHQILLQSPQNVPHTLSGVSCCAGKSRPWRIQTSTLDHLGLIFIARFEVAGEQMIHNFFRRDFCHFIFNFVATLTLQNSIDQLQVVACPELAFVYLWGRPMSTRRSTNRKSKVLKACETKLFSRS